MSEIMIKLKNEEQVNEFCYITGKCSFDVDAVSQNRRYTIDAKSFLGVLFLGTSTPMTIIVYDRGEEVENYLKEIQEKFGV